VVADDGAVADPLGTAPIPAAVFNLGDEGAVRVPFFAALGIGGVPESMSMASASPFTVSSENAWYFGREASAWSCVFELAFVGTEAFLAAAFVRFVASEARRGDVSLFCANTQCGFLNVSFQYWGLNFVVCAAASDGWGKFAFGGGPGGGGGIGYDCDCDSGCAKGDTGGGPIDPVENGLRSDVVRCGFLPRVGEALPLLLEPFCMLGAK
jgi:hypothetical protein